MHQTMGKLRSRMETLVRVGIHKLNIGVFNSRSSTGGLRSQESPVANTAFDPVA